MARVQLALNVSDLDEAVDFYSKLFGAAPAKVAPGYANFAVADPPLKLVLFERAEGGTINHLGVEVESANEVEATQRRLEAEELGLTEEMGTTCCYAVQDKVWAAGPDELSWEVYTVLDDTPLEDAPDAACGPGICA